MAAISDTMAAFWSGVTCRPNAVSTDSTATTAATLVFQLIWIFIDFYLRNSHLTFPSSTFLLANSKLPLASCSTNPKPWFHWFRLA